MKQNSSWSMAEGGSSRSWCGSCRLVKSFNRQLYGESLESDEEPQLSCGTGESKTALGEDWWSRGWMQPGHGKVQTFICAAVIPRVTAVGVKRCHSSLSKCVVNKVLGEVGNAPSPGIYVTLSIPAYSSPLST